MSDGIDFTGQVIAITGAGKGLGRQYALYLARQGAHVVVNNRRHAGEDTSSADRTVAEIVEQGGSAIANYVSVEQPDAGQQLLADALEKFGRLDGLIVNAAITNAVVFHKETPEQFQRMIDINLFGTYNVVHPVYRHMLEQQSGKILLSTSTAGLFGEYGLAAYATSKAAVLGLMWSLSLEGGRKGIRVNAIAPYATTNMTAEHLDKTLHAPLDAARVAPIAAWLVSDRCSANGEIVIAAAGKVARARMETTRPLVADELDTDVWTSLVEAPLESEFAGAGEHFRWFMEN